MLNSALLLVHTILIFLLVTLSSTNVMGQEKRIKYRIVAISNDSVKSYSNEVLGKGPKTLYLPNAFTPNGDGLNDQFNVVGEGIKKIEISVYNRWGNLVYQSNNQVSWDGTYKGDLVPQDVYSFDLFAVMDDNKVIKKQGVISVIY